ncbi:hypothetical protein D3C87_1558330 [compost metagenome]
MPGCEIGLGVIDEYVHRPHPNTWVGNAFDLVIELQVRGTDLERHVRHVRAVLDDSAPAFDGLAIQLVESTQECCTLLQRHVDGDEALVPRHEESNPGTAPLIRSARAVALIGRQVDLLSLVRHCRDDSFLRGIGASQEQGSLALG